MTTRPAASTSSARRSRRPGGRSPRVRGARGQEGRNDGPARGLDLIRKALQAPLRQIAENAGHDGAVVAGKLIDGEDPTTGFKAPTEAHENTAQGGARRPTQVVRTALQDAA